jgi:hypothetical protein
MVQKRIGTYKVRGIAEPVILLKGAKIGDSFDEYLDEKTGEYTLQKVQEH